MKKILVALVVGMFAASAFAAEGTTTSSQNNTGASNVSVHKAKKAKKKAGKKAKKGKKEGSADAGATGGAAPATPAGQ